MANVNIVLQPSSVLVQENETVTFSTSGSLANTALSGNTVVYQWQSATAGSTSFSNVAGATSTSYTLTAFAALDNYSYRASLSAQGVDSVVYTDSVTLGVRVSADQYSPWETLTEAGSARVRRLIALGYL